MGVNMSYDAFINGAAAMFLAGGIFHVYYSCWKDSKREERRLQELDRHK